MVLYRPDRLACIDSYDLAIQVSAYGDVDTKMAAIQCFEIVLGAIPCIC